MTDGTDRPHSPQPEPAPEGGYGFPPGVPAPGGYGFPPGRPEPYDRPAPDGGHGYGFPPGQDGPSDRPASGEGGYGYPQGGGYGYPPGPPVSGTFGPPMPFPEDSDQGGPAGAQVPPGPGAPAGPQAVSFGEQPDWEAMADRSAAERRRKRLWKVGGAVTVLALLAGGGAFVLLKTDLVGGGGGGKDDAKGPSPSASVSGSPDPGKSPSKAYSPTVASDPALLKDGVGKIGIRMGPEATVPKDGSHYEFTLKGNPNSYGQSTASAVDTTKSFSLSARVKNNSDAKGPHVVMSQGTSESFSFELGSDEVNGKQAWVFRVRTPEKGAAPTVVTVAAEGLNTVKTWSILTAVHDAEKKKISLYVEGKKAAEAPVAGIWPNSGPLQIGRARHQNAWAGAFKGEMNFMRIYASAFSDEQAAAYRQGELDAAARGTLTHSWVTG